MSAKAAHVVRGDSAKLGAACCLALVLLFLGAISAFHRLDADGSLLAGGFIVLLLALGIVTIVSTRGVLKGPLIVVEDDEVRVRSSIFSNRKWVRSKLSEIVRFEVCNGQLVIGRQYGEKISLFVWLMRANDIEHLKNYLASRSIKTFKK